MLLAGYPIFNLGSEADLSVSGMEPSGNRQYGLIKRQQKSSSVTAPKPSVFGANSDSDSEQSQQGNDWYKSAMRTAATGSVQAAQTRQVLRKAAEQDASVFQYDEVYDTLQRSDPDGGGGVASAPVQKKPRYMARLLATAEKRKQEHERRIERKVQQEREEEGDEFADKESFVTEAYKQKLLERQKQDEEERRRRLQEEAYDVTKQEDLSGLYRHLFLKREKQDNNMASGESKNDGEKSKETVKVKEENSSNRENSLSGDENSDEKNTETQIKFNKVRKSQTSIRRRRNSSDSSDCEERSRDRSHQTKSKLSSGTDSHRRRSGDRRLISPGKPGYKNHSSSREERRSRDRSPGRHGHRNDPSSREERKSRDHSPRRHGHRNDPSSREERRSRDHSPGRHGHRREPLSREERRSRDRSPGRHGHRNEVSSREERKSVGSRNRSGSGGRRHCSDQDREGDHDRRKIDDQSSNKRKHSPKPPQQNHSETVSVLEKSQANSAEERAKRREKLFTKRTVGAEFEAALARYQARKENGPPLIPVQN